MVSFIRQGSKLATVLSSAEKTWCLLKNGTRGDGGNPVAIGGPFCGSLYLHPHLLLHHLLLLPLLLPLCNPWLSYFQGCLGPFPLFWILLLQACGRHVTGMLQACSKHGHFHLAAYATQVRWLVAWAAPTPCLAGELSGGGAWFPGYSLSLERN